MRSAPLFFGLLLAACGDPAPPLPAPIPIPWIEAGADRTAHVARALERASDLETQALVLRVAAVIRPEDGQTHETLARVAARCAEPQALTDREAAVSLDALVAARRHHALRRAVIPIVLSRLAEDLLGRRRSDGTWGDLDTTCWSAAALISARGESSWVADRTDAAWHEGEIDFRSLLRAANGREPIERLRLATLVVTWLSREPSRPVPSVEDQRIVRGLLQDVPVDGDADLLLAWAHLWWRAGPARGSTHPAAPARRRFRERYEAGELSAGSPDELARLVVALEWFGYDSFGAIMGYLPDCDWEPAPR